jgi:methylmalonyl-CoA/ethylmalonyl-CoA epimerase
MSEFNLSGWALGHRSLVAYIMIIAVVVGTLSYFRLGRSEDPSFIIKTMVVQAAWPGATVNETLKQVTERLERKLQETPHLDSLRSFTRAGVTTIFVNLPNTKIELLDPLGENSPIAKFLERNADGGIHHICYEVDDIIAARDRLVGKGARVLGDGNPKTGAHGKPVLFLHPKDFCGTLVELEQV